MSDVQRRKARYDARARTAKRERLEAIGDPCGGEQHSYLRVLLGKKKKASSL